jgi:hypothetical protein
MLEPGVVLAVEIHHIWLSSLPYQNWQIVLLGNCAEAVNPAQESAMEFTTHWRK